MEIIALALPPAKLSNAISVIESAHLGMLNSSALNNYMKSFFGYPVAGSGWGRTLHSFSARSSPVAGESPSNSNASPTR